MAERLTIVGGGLAGLTLGIGLRQRGVPVTIWESGRYPRPRVCGEFISGDGQGALARLGLLPGLRELGIWTASSAAFYSGKGLLASGTLPAPALCVSRQVLDTWLAERFEALGGELRVEARWNGGFGAGVVRASGRRIEPAGTGWRWFGLKIHAQGVALESDLEMHLVPGGYVGLCRLPGDEVNVCGLFRSRTPVPDLAQRWLDWLGGAPGSQLRTRLAGARFDPASQCSVAGLHWAPHRAGERVECCLGDALTLIPPVTGNGMSMAFEAAELGVAPLTAYSRAERSWAEARRTLAEDCDRRFASRLRWAGGLQWALFQPVVRRLLALEPVRLGWLWPTLFRQTR
jgi:2-polyprenyl-6-methoxyphenol hydroxylase-like FAD-dependent oxidoreductase